MLYNVVLRSFLILIFATALQSCGHDNNDATNSDAANRERINTTNSDSTAEFSNLDPSHQSTYSRALPFKEDVRISYCEMKDNVIQGFRDRQLYPLASLSKVVTSAWALDQFGSDHRFKSEWFLRPVDSRNGIFDAYLRTNYDPIVNTEKILYFLAQLKAQGVRSIRELTIDETTRVYLSVLNQPHLELDRVPISIEDSGKSLFLAMNSENWGSQTSSALKNLKVWMQSKNISLDVPGSFEVQSVVYRPSHEVNRTGYRQSFTVLSAPLLSYLKSINVTSNNYISDFLFWRLGQAAKFVQFQRERLKLSSQDLVMYTGSGLAMNQSGIRKDNLGTCRSILKVLSFVHQKANEVKLNLGYLLLNSSRDTQGTLQTQVPLSLRMDNLVVKTGRLYDNPALNLAGVVSTKIGAVYFTFLGHNFKNSDAGLIEKTRDIMLTDLLKFYPTQPSFVSTASTTIFL